MQGKLSMNPFDYLNSINVSKQDIMVDDLAEKEYNAFLVNRGLSYFSDTVLFANEMNYNHHVDYRLQYDFLINTIRKRKRFSKWHKTNNPDDLACVQKYFNYSSEKAKGAMSVLTEDDISKIRKRMSQGGKSK